MISAEELKAALKDIGRELDEAEDREALLGELLVAARRWRSSFRAQRPPVRRPART